MIETVDIPASVVLDKLLAKIQKEVSEWKLERNSATKTAYIDAFYEIQNFIYELNVKEKR